MSIYNKKQTSAVKSVETEEPVSLAGFCPYQESYIIGLFEPFLSFYLFLE